MSQWTEQETRFLPMHEWDACGFPIDVDGLKGRRCYAGLDLSSTTDLSALSLVFPPTATDDKFVVLPFFWIPEQNVRERERRDRVPYTQWVKDGRIEATPGNMIDYDYILRRIGLCRIDYDLRMLAFDPFGSHKLVPDLSRDYDFVESGQERPGDSRAVLFQFRQNPATYGAPTKELLTLVLGRKIAHAGNPVLRWNAANVVVEVDSNENLKPSKKRSSDRIDGICATIMALDLATRFAAEAPMRSVYDTRGVLYL